MPPVLSKLTSFFPPVITDREKAFFTDGRFEEIRSRALSQKKADAQQQELWEDLMLYEEPETIEEISSAGDLVIATFEEPNSDLDNLM